MCVTIAANLPETAVHATDVSAVAIAVTKENIRKYNLEKRVFPRKGSLFEPVADMKFDVIVSNPPYIPTEIIPTLQDEVRLEPACALDGGKDGLDFYRVILTEARIALARGGFCAFEVGAGQAESVCDIAGMEGFARTEIISDLSGVKRVVIAFK